MLPFPHRNEHSRMGPAGLEKTDQGNLPLGMVLVHRRGVSCTPSLSSAAMSLRPGQKTLSKMCSEGPSSEWHSLTLVELSSAGWGQWDLERHIEAVFCWWWHLLNLGEGENIDPHSKATKFNDCLPLVSPEKEKSTGPCWVQLTVFFPGFKLRRVVSPVFGRLG